MASLYITIQDSHRPVYVKSCTGYGHALQRISRVASPQITEVGKRIFLLEHCMKNLISQQSSRSNIKQCVECIPSHSYWGKCPISVHHRKPRKLRLVKCKKNWAQWWTTSTHLKCFLQHSWTVGKVWQRSTNAVEWKNRECKSDAKSKKEINDGSI